MKPLLFAPTVVRLRLEAQFVRNGHDQVLLFREWKRFERTKNTGLVHDFQLLGHKLIVPCAGLGGAAYGATKSQA